MNIKNYALIGLAGISSLNTTVKAQKFLPKSVSVFTEIGVSACAHQEMALYRGANIGFQSGNNRINTFLGASLNSDKKADFNGMVTNNFKWHKYSNFSSWCKRAHGLISCFTWFDYFGQLYLKEFIKMS